MVNPYSQKKTFGENWSKLFYGPDALAVAQLIMSEQIVFRMHTVLLLSAN